MRIIRPSSYDEFVCWYLLREERKNDEKLNPSVRATTKAMREYMEKEHGEGKLRPWFRTGRWHIVELETLQEVNSLIGLASDWTKKALLLNDENSLDYRLLGVMVENAKETNYFGQIEELGINSDEYDSRQKYIKRFQEAWLELREDDRIVIVSPWENEKAENPSGTYYLHDGLGRILAYLYLIECGDGQYSPVEAFLAEQNE